MSPATPEERISEVAYRYDGPDDEGARLTEAALRRLDWRKRNSGKECSLCKETKPIRAFSKDSSAPDGLNHRCRSCDHDVYWSRKRHDRTFPE